MLGECLRNAGVLCNGIGDVPGCETADLRVLGYIRGYLGYVTTRTRIDPVSTLINKLHVRVEAKGS